MLRLLPLRRSLSLAASGGTLPTLARRAVAGGLTAAVAAKAASTCIASCDAAEANPLLDAPALFPRFADIRAEHVEPAMKARLAEAQASLTALELDVEETLARGETPSYLHLADSVERLGELVSGPWQAVGHLKMVKDSDALRAAGIDPAQVAEVFAEVMFDQVFTHSFVHADPHPGNIFVTPTSPTPSTTPTADTTDATPGGFRLTFIDFGMMAEIPASLRDGLRTLLIAVTGRDSRGLVAAAQEIGVLLPSADTRELERALTALFARFGGMGFAELSKVDPREFRDFAEEFGDMVRSLPLQLPENMLLLIRAVSLTSGMCSGLDPAFNVWDAAEPYAGRLLRDESGNIVQAFASQAMDTMNTTWRLPKRIDDIITRVDDGTVSFDTSRLERRLDRLEGIARRIASGVLFAAMLIGGALLVPAVPPLGITLICVSALPLLHSLFAGVGRRGPR